MKHCKDCQTSKPASEFNRKGDRFQSRCRECQKKWYKNYYDTVDKERERLYTRNKVSQDTLRRVTREARDVPCMDCGVEYPFYVMDFDHRDPSSKEFTVASMINLGSVEKIEKEISKCDVVCSNCHRIRTWEGNYKKLI